MGRDLLSDDDDTDEEMPQRGPKRGGPEDSRRSKSIKRMDRQLPKEGEDEEEEVETRHNGRSSRSKPRGNPQQKKTVTKAMKDQQALLTLVLKSVLQQQQKMRDVEGVIFTVFEAPEEDEVVKAGARQGKLYSKKVEELGKGHGLGPPHLFVMAAIIKTIQKDLQSQVDGAPTEENQEQLNGLKQQLHKMTSLQQQWSQLSTSQKDDIVPFIRIAKMYKQDKRKIIISMNSHSEYAAELRKIVLKHMKERPEWDMKTGRPPAGHMERELATWLKLMIED